MENSEITKGLLGFLDSSPTAFHAVRSAAGILAENGYVRLEEKDLWELEKGGKYYVTRNASSLIAFRIPVQGYAGFMIAASHCDSPAFKIKEDPEIVSDGYVRLNVERYGGMLCAPWFDRPLSVAGRVIVRTDAGIETKLVDIGRDVALIPNLAIHMNRKANEGVAYNIQKDLLPVIGSDEVKGCFMKTVAQEAGVNEKDILGHDLFLYVRDKGTVWGLADEYVSAPHLDDLQCTYGNLLGFISAEPGAGIPVLAVFDNEEVGSSTKQGANSTFLEDILKRIMTALGMDTQEQLRMPASSFMVSADNAHAVHPANMDKADPVNRPQINKGIVLKYSANQKYTTDAVSAAVVRTVCEKAGVPVQVFTNRSDMIGGSTLGNISNSHISLNTADIGLPQLAMHSCYETAGVKDTAYLAEMMKLFFSLSVQTECDGNYTLK
ncbi:MAG: M18 family aminopeptidase [Solobacterium sp.]|nr:M18 family aminopeptidase [Solobacterium sp.]